MRHRRLIAAATIAALTLVVSTAGAQAPASAAKPRAHKMAKHETEADLMKLATITRDSATTVALGAVPGGTVKSSELEREHHKVVYSFDIAVDGKSGVDEVQIDAVTGKVVSKEHESAKKERKEMKKEAKEAKEAKEKAEKKP